MGIPLSQELVFHPNELVLVGPNDSTIPIQSEVLNRWFDGSIKWVLLDFRVSVDAWGQRTYWLQRRLETQIESFPLSLTVQKSQESIIVDTGKGTFVVNSLGQLFGRVSVQKSEVLGARGGGFILIDEEGNESVPETQGLCIETLGPLRVTLSLQGAFHPTVRLGRLLFSTRLNFHALSSFVELQITIRNPAAARHPYGLWDLGDEGSVYFKDLSLHLALPDSQKVTFGWATQRLHSMKKRDATRVEIYQDSSGGENWQSRNHVNRFGKVVQTFRGCRVTVNHAVLEEERRPEPVLAGFDDKVAVIVAIENFWQNFPKALEARDNQLIVRLFPQQANDVFELQGGEQKTHTIYLQFCEASSQLPELSWVHDRLVPRVTPEWYCNSKVVAYLTPRSKEQSSECQSLIKSAIEGEQTFFARREIIDEYGWRHFGDLYADHEAVRATGDVPLIAHYNNQYDVIYGALVQYFRSGDLRWFTLARDLARHVIDIDIYHTQEDRFSYNGGLFWHTDHYFDAATATHRAYSKANQQGNPPGAYGGGLSNEHNYTTGLLFYYFLTGDSGAQKAVVELANWVIGRENGSQRLFGLFDRRPTGFSSSTAGRNYHGPGRGAGNSINALLDAYVLTCEERYLAKAEQLITRCIHPREDIDARRLDDVEHRWSYTVFLQVLSKYLDLKVEKGETDFIYCYAQASLLHYAEWMLAHEVPYTQVLDRVEIPTETWPAQDIRKSCVFHFAAKYAPEPLRSAFQRKADFFFQACIRDLHSWNTRTLTRPLVLLITNEYVHSFFQQYPDETAPQPASQYDFGLPQQFTPQFTELYWLREKLHGAGNMMKEAGRLFGSLIQKKLHHLGVLRD
jgi:hypothetical protein